MSAIKISGGYKAIKKSLTLADLSLVCVAVGIFLRIQLWLKDTPLWGDEQMVAINIRDRDFWHMAGFLDLHQNAPLGWLQLEWLFGHGIGFGERTLRVIPLVFGIASVFVAWWIGRRWFNVVGAVVFVGLVAVAPHLVYYSAEVKPYAVDVFFTLLMLAISGTILDRLRAEASAPEGALRAERTILRRRMWAWWIVGTIAGWFSLAAVQLILPVTILLVGVIWYRHGRAAALRTLIPGLIWFAVFALHFVLAIRYTVGDAWLADAWKDAYAPRPYGFTSFTAWLAGIAPGMGWKPIGTFYGTLFWVVTALGIAAIARRRKDLALLISLPLVVIYVLGVLRLAPPVDRIVLWVVPALFVAFAAACQAFFDWGVGWGAVLAAKARAGRQRQAANLGVPVAAGLVLALFVTAFFAVPMARKAHQGPPWQAASDDRAAVQWMLRNHEKGDLVLVAALSRMATSWYADAPKWNVQPPGLKPIKLIHFGPPGRNCDPQQLSRTVAGHKRVLFFTGSNFFAGFPQTITRIRMKQLATEQAVYHFGKYGAVYVFDTRKPPTEDLPDDLRLVLTQHRSNCVKVMPYNYPY